MNTYFTFQLNWTAKSWRNINDYGAFWKSFFLIKTQLWINLEKATAGPKQNNNLFNKMILVQIIFLPTQTA